MHTIKLDAGRVLRFLLIVIAGLLLIHIALQFVYRVLDIDFVSTLRGRFDVDNEISIPDWFSQIILFVPVILGGILASISRKKKDGNAIYWGLLTLLFLYLSVDEGAMLHEAFITKFREWTVSSGSSGLAEHTWLIPVGLAFCAMLVPFVRFLRRLPARTVRLLCLGVAIYVSGAIIFETIDLTYITGNFAYHGLAVAFEEGLEMVGTSLIIYTLLDYLRRTTDSIKVTLS